MNTEAHNGSCVAGKTHLLLVHLGASWLLFFFFILLLMIPCLHFRSQWGSQTKLVKSAHVLWRNYANEGKTTKKKKSLIVTLHSPEPQIKNSFIC